MTKIIMADGKVAQLVRRTLTEESMAYDIVLKPKRIMCDTRRHAEGLFDDIEHLIASTNHNIVNS